MSEIDNDEQQHPRKHPDSKEMPAGQQTDHAQTANEGGSTAAPQISQKTQWREELNRAFDEYEKHEVEFNEREEQKEADRIAERERKAREAAARQQREFYAKRAQAFNSQYDRARQAAQSSSRGSGSAQQTAHPRSERVSAFEPDAERMRYEQAHEKTKRKPLSKRTKLIIAAVAAVVAVVAIYYTQFSPMTVYVNGQQTQVMRGSTVDDAIKASGVQTVPGRLLAVDGSVLDENGGDAYSATSNGDTVDGTAHLSDDEEIDVEQGADTTEDFTENTESIPAQIVDDGSTGAVHKVIGYSDMKDGTKTTKTGNISGITVDDQVVEEPVNATLTRYNINTGGDKVVCLTFDDGPWHDTTSSILDTLEENGAVATFFTVGKEIEKTDGGADLLQREINDGCLVCTHTYDHAAGSGKSVNLGYMTAQEQIDEIVNGMQAIKDATGQDVSRIVRVPGGNYPPEVAQNLAPYIDYEVDWNVETGDWAKPGTDSIVKAIESAGPGDIILMHDGGGDRTQTAEAINVAIPYLKEQGYTFLTVDQLLSKYDSNYGQ